MTSLGAIIVAAGSSTRMGTVDKIWATLAARPLLTYSLSAFSGLASRITLVVRSEDVDRASSFIELGEYFTPCTVVAGGARRQDSVRCGLSTMGDVELVAIHDAARPLVTRGLIDEVWRAAAETRAAIPAIPVPDTLKRVQGGRVVGTMDRTNVWSVQTPQIFARELVAAAHAHAEEHHLEATDDSSLVEAVGGIVRVVEGSPWNIKVTRLEDLARAEAILQLRCAHGAFPPQTSDVTGPM